MAEKTKVRNGEATKLAEALQKAKSKQGEAVYEIGRIAQLVMETSLWDAWPRTSKDVGKRRRKRATFGYDSFGEWCWDAVGAHPGTVRRYAADYRRMTAFGIKPTSTLFKRMMAIGTNKRHLIICRAVNWKDEDAFKKVEEWVGKVEEWNMTAHQLLVALRADEETLPDRPQSSVPSQRPPRGGRPTRWNRVDKMMEAAYEYCSLCDATSAANCLERALAFVKEIRDA